VQRYLAAARRHRALIVAILAIVWLAGGLAAATEYRTTFESTASIWVLRASPELAQSSADDPSVTLLQTAASQQVDLISQLLQTDSFVSDVAGRAGLVVPVGADESAYLDSLRKRFHVKALGTNLLSLSYAARDPESGPKLVNAALAVRGERTAAARVASTTALVTLYQKDYELAQTEAQSAQRNLQAFDEGHPAPMSDVDQHSEAQLRLLLDLAQARLSDLRGRLDRAALAPALIDVSGMEFQVVDPPRRPSAPSGGTRSALTIAAIALVAGAALAALLVLLSAHVPRVPVAVAQRERSARAIDGAEALQSRPA